MCAHSAIIPRMVHVITALVMKSLQPVGDEIHPKSHLWEAREKFPFAERIERGRAGKEAMAGKLSWWYSPGPSLTPAHSVEKAAMTSQESAAQEGYDFCCLTVRVARQGGESSTVCGFCN